MVQKEAKIPQKSRRGPVENPAEPRFLVIGEITKPHGVHGEVRVIPHTDLPERFNWLETVYIGRREPVLFVVESVRFHKSAILLKLAGFDDRAAADSLRGKWLQVPEADGIPLAEGEYYLFQLIGLEVFSDDGADLGRLVEVIETGANHVFVVRSSNDETLLPNISEVVKNIDFENGRMLVHLMPGLK